MITPGEVIEVSCYPFVRCMATAYDGEGLVDFLSWRPGIVYRPQGQYSDDENRIAHGLGAMILTVVSMHKPGRYPARVFYTRQWVNPDGTRFGKGALRIATEEKFKRLARSYAYPFSVDEPEEGEVK